jgi:photosystem II oxygen-evolving enhancer protein 3
VGVKSLIDKKAWPYVQNGLRDYAGSLRFDLNTIISSKSKEEKKSLKKITASLYDSLNKVRFMIYYARSLLALLLSNNCSAKQTDMF